VGQQALADHFEITPPQRLVSTVQGATPSHIERHREAKVGLVLENVLVWPELSVAATKDGRLIAETLPAPQYRVAKLNRFGAFDNTTPADEIDAMASIGCGYWSNYYHKLIDEIPRLWAMGEHCSPEELDVWLPSYYDAAFRELIRVLAPSTFSFVQVENPSAPVVARRYVHIPMLSNNFCGYVPPSYVQWLHARLREHCSGTDGDRTPPRRIYVSRSEATKRRLENESDIRGVLEQFGYEVHHPETLSPLQQARLFAGAKRIAGVHGAGLANILYASKGHLLEFFPGAPLYHYRWLSEACGHGYQNIVSENPKTHKHGDFRLPTDRLRAVLNTLDDSSRSPLSATRK